ncbi:hypothetical protein KI387_025126, partial [Taxus chinensis]
KIVLRSEIDSEKCKSKALQAIAEIKGVDSVTVDLKEKKIIVIGDADPVVLTRKLRKVRNTELVSVGPAREEVRYLRHMEVPNPVPTGTNHHCQGLSTVSEDNPNACSIS